MANMTEFKRLNFFTGFFTTADDWNQGQEYHQAKRRLHNRGLHTPGIIPGEGGELGVEAAGGLNLRVLTGAALDGDGNEIYLGISRTLTVDPGEYELPQLVYVVIRYREYESDYVENVDAPEYSGNTRVTEIPTVELSISAPDNQTAIEIARIDLQPGVTEITVPEDPAHPGGNQIDRRFVHWAGSVGVSEPELPPQVLERLVQLMVDNRRDFAALEGRFPVPSAGDVRHAAISLEMLTRLGAVKAVQLGDVLATLAAIEQDVAQELGTSYPALPSITEFQAYRDAVSRLLETISSGPAPDEDQSAHIDLILTRQAAVAEAARELAEVVLRAPEAEAGTDVTVTAHEGEATVPLDASGSRAFEGRDIVRYRWDLRRD